MDDLQLLERLLAVCGELEASSAKASPEIKRLAAELADLRGRALPALERLKSSSDRLAELETDFEQAVATAKLSAIKEFAYGASHEINNPLANISARAQTLLQDERDPERRRRLAAINSQAFRAHEMIADVMLFARPPRLRRAPVELVGFLREIGAAFRPDAERQRTELVFRPGQAELICEADAVQLRVAIGAVITNALEALGEGGLVEIDVQPAADAPKISGKHSPTARIAIWDTGPGVPPAQRPQIFDPFYCGREAGRGIGLGLSKAWRIISEHGGRIELVDSERGAKFQISL